MVFIGFLALLAAVNYCFEEIWSKERWVEKRSINRLVRREKRGLPNDYTGMTNCRSSRRHYGGYYAENKKSRRWGERRP